MEQAQAGTAALLRRAQVLLSPLAVRFPAAERGLDLLQRDLLPRSAGGDVYLIAGIVGPNNAGKSALFNALVGRDVSPSLPAGGATRRLIGAAHPDLLARLREEPTLARFHLRPAGAGGEPVAEALESGEDAAELLVVAEAGLPDAIMLIDTPDFDSILQDNRLASESLLAVADLVIAVVTRHSYQNREVVSFLDHWLAHGRPWMLVYNEAPDEEVARSHAAKLAHDIGTLPLVQFWAAHSLAVQQGETALEPRALALDAPQVPVSRGTPLRDFLFDESMTAAVKARALNAAQARLCDELEGTASALVAHASQGQAVLTAVQERAAQTGFEIASAAMPAGPFVDAFRTVLDRRSNPISRRWRTALRRLRLTIESLPRALLGRGDPAGAPAMSKLSAAEHDAFERSWPAYWESVVRDLGPEARHSARHAAPPSVVALLDRDLADERRAAARARVEAALRTPPDVAEFRRACEGLIEKAIEERGFDMDIQAAADLVTLLPIAAAGLVIVTTSGLGSDLAAAGMGAAGTYLLEKYAHVLGGGIMAAARRRWTDLRSAQLAELLLDATLEESAPVLRAAAAGDMALARELRELRAELK